MDTTIDTQRIISYCTGTRGLERGLERTGIPMQTIAFLEIEAFIVGNLVAQMEAGLLAPAPVWTNIKTFDARPFRNKIHGIVGGYPCQPFSHAGERKGADDERHLWPYILKQIKIIGPQWVYFENVAGHLSLGYDEVRRSLSDIGYRVEEGIFTAEEVGAPHRRERLFILGTLENASILGWRRRAIGYSSKGSKSEDKVKGSGACMANTNCNDSGTRFGNVSEQKGKSIGKEDKRERCWDESRTFNSDVADSTVEGLQISRSTGEREHAEENKQWLDDRPEQRDNAVDNTVNKGLQGYSGNDCGKGRWPQQERSVAETGLFPAGQGTYQHQWEEPRTIESGLVYTIDGYNFTEDLHRAIGNSVVEQVSELAFNSLLHKHINNDITN